MKRQTILLGVAALILIGLTGFYVGFLMEEDELRPAENEEFSQGVNYTVSADNDVTTADFDERSLDLFHEGGQEARFYLDMDQDGSADVELEGLQRDGRLHTTSETVTLQNKTYRLYFRYQDSAEERGDAQLWLYHVEVL